LSLQRAGKESAAVQKIAGCAHLNWTEPEDPQTFFQICGPPVILYVRGAIISEFPLHAHSAPENFPGRNRIAAGMPLGVVVVCAQYSGSLITAPLAMEFGREVFGVPGMSRSP
jgi:predicted Rossmann fold nucleotide-binding protein DprA/Smf involved in DNA uptake